jgi:hypothetical protein
MASRKLVIGILAAPLLFVVVGLWTIVAPVIRSAPRPTTEISVSTQRLRQDVLALASTDDARSYDNPVALEAAALYIESELAKAGMHARRQSFRVGPREYHNVIAMYGYGGAARLVIGAHYDVCERQPGADDNASGVAGLLEIARLLQTRSPKLPYEIELVAYTLEEPPFFRTAQMGSAVHARELSTSGTPVIGMIALEMIGYFSDALDSQDYPMPLLSWLYPTQGNFIAVVGRLGEGDWVRSVKAPMTAVSGPPVVSIAAPPFVPGVDFSDHLNYWAKGYRAVMVTDTAFLRNANYHEVTDTPDTLDYERMAGVVRQVYWTAVNQEL